MNSNRALNLYIYGWLINLFLSGVLGLNALASLAFDGLALWSLFYLFQVLKNWSKLPDLMKSFLLLFFMFTVYGVALILSDHVYYVEVSNRFIPNQAFLMQIYRSMLPIFTFYFFASKRVLNQSNIARYVPFYLVIITLTFIKNSILRSDLMATEEVTNNIGYTFASFMPLLIFYDKNRKMQYLAMGFCLAMILLGMKRGAILTGGLAFMVFLFYQRKLTSRGNSNLKFYFAVFAVAVIAFLAVYYMLESSDYFSQRVEDTLDGKTSGRDKLYDFFLDYYLYNLSTAEKIFGLGANATLGIFWNYAHNDWLEIAINHGIIGLITYITLWSIFVKSISKKKIPLNVRYALIMIFVIFFMKTIFSMSYRTYNLYSALPLGYCMVFLSKYPPKKKRIINETNRCNNSVG